MLKTVFIMFSRKSNKDYIKTQVIRLPKSRSGSQVLWEPLIPALLFNGGSAVEFSRERMQKDVKDN